MKKGNQTTFDGMQPPTTYRRTKFVEDKYLMDWIGANMPPAAEGYTGTDLDLILRDRAGNMMMVETKRKKAEVKDHQSITFQIIDAALRQISGNPIGVKLADGTSFPIKIKYLGFKLLQFENTTFSDGRVWLNSQERTEEEIKNIFSFKTNK